MADFTAKRLESQHRGQARMAYRLAAAYDDRLMFVHGIGWHRWDGRRWAEDDQGAAKRAVLDVLRSAWSEGQYDKDLAADVNKCQSASGVSGVLDLAAALPPFAHTVADLDADPYLLNVANGTLDLHTFELAEHDPADRITKVTTGAYDEAASGPLWSAHLERVLPDAEVREFLQRLAGVGLLGVVVEHVLGILTGEGRNGKGVFYGALGHALGDYATVAEPDLFMHREGAHPTGEMDLRGVRWAVVSENDKGRRLAEATMKRLTGGDEVKARRMRQDFVRFKPSHTPVLVTNHLPVVSGDDPALWARMRVVPFNVTIPDDEQDKHLEERLSCEADSIVSWAVAGYREYCARGGLDEPAAVLRATDTYHRDSDALGRFLDECCLVESTARARAGVLFTEWCAWCSRNGETPGRTNELAHALERRGFTKSKRKTGAEWAGLGLLAREGG
ncbi:MAG TPA: phage/plasmid primase, P4 family [Nocardioidaceae bacterium]|nr:phage/plasmid primase, P4 family [Nocardioidaceae bacterium]